MQRMLARNMDVTDRGTQMRDQLKDANGQAVPAEIETQWSGIERRRWPRAPEDQNKPIVKDTPVLSPLHFSTKDLPPDGQFEAWRAHMKPVVDVLLPDNISINDGFEARHTVWHLGKMLLVQQYSDAYHYIRTSSQLRNSPVDHWYLGIRRTGNAWTEVDGHVIKTGPGNVAFRTLGYPYRGRCTQSEITLLYMPYSLFADEAGIFKGANNTILSGNLTDLLFNYITQVEARLPILTAVDLPRIVHTIRNMIINGVGPLSEAEPNASVNVNLGKMERIHHYIHHHLYDPQLTPDRICREVGISRTSLYQLFEAKSGVFNYIRKQRLQAAYEALSDPKNKQRVLDIAQKAGFEVAANFTRAFISEFGLTPSEVRRKLSMAYSGTAFVARDSSNSKNFESWIKNLDI